MVERNGSDLATGILGTEGSGGGKEHRVFVDGGSKMWAHDGVKIIVAGCQVNAYFLRRKTFLSL
jgi:hypothetical protein